MIRKLLIILLALLISGCSNDIHTIKQNEEQLRPYSQLHCTRNNEGFYYCENEVDEDGDRLIYRNGKIVDKIVLDNGIKLYNDPSCSNCAYTAFHKEFESQYNGHTLLTSYIDRNYVTILYDRLTGEVFRSFDGALLRLYINGEESQRWSTLFDSLTNKFKLIDMNTWDTYKDINLNLNVAPALNSYYQLGNSLYFTGYTEVDGIRTNYIFDHSGKEILCSKEFFIEVDSSTQYFPIISNNKYGLITIDGTKVLPLEYDAVVAYKNGITAIKDDRLYVFSSTLKPLINGEYKVSPKEFTRNLCCDNYNNFMAYDDGDSLIVTTIDTDHIYSRKSIPLNPEYMHKFKVNGESIIELEYDYRY